MPSQISFGDIYSKANGSTPGSATRFLTMSTLSYFEGPNGNNTISYNAWGIWGNTTGSNEIYGMPIPRSASFQFNEWGGGFVSPTNVKDYFYDGTEYKCNLTVYNNLGPSQPFPPPPIDNTVQDVNLTLKDSSNTYPYITLGTGAIISLGDGGGTYGPTDAASSGISPLINTAYWTITIASGPNFPGALADFTLNGAGGFTGAVVGGGGASTVFNFITYGTATMTGGYGGNTAGFEFVLTIY